jgi:hypothetical protein
MADHLPQIPQQLPPHLPPNFPNIGISDSDLSQVEEMFNSLSLQTNNSGHIPRELEMIASAPNQQQQDGPMNHTTLTTQRQPNLNTQPKQNQPVQSDAFSSPQASTSDSVRNPPSHSSQPGSLANNPPVAQQNPQGLPPGRRSLTIPELWERFQVVQRGIKVNDDLIAQLLAQRTGMSDAVFITKMQILMKYANIHKDVLNKILYVIKMTTNGPSGRNNGNM